MSSRQDFEQLNLLAILHYVMAGLCALSALFPLLYLALGFVALNGGAPKELAIMFIAFGGGFGGLLLLFAFLIGLAGYYLHKRKARTFCFIIAAVQCTQMPLGTVLGIFTILVLSRDSVQELFAGGGRFHDPEDDDDGPPRHFEDDRFGPDDRDRYGPDDWRREGRGYYGRDDHDH
jgi:hypothetical protein